jgi:SAM-dependent MidA family methyltransferase
MDFSISWYPNVAALYNETLEKSVKNAKAKLSEQGKEISGRDKRSLLKIKPAFVFAHELYDALPIHQFKYLGQDKWAEVMVGVEGMEDPNTISRDKAPDL